MAYGITNVKNFPEVKELSLLFVVSGSWSRAVWNEQSSSTYHNVENVKCSKDIGFMPTGAWENVTFRTVCTYIVMRNNLLHKLSKAR